jgi:hypothetical protein
MAETAQASRSIFEGDNVNVIWTKDAQGRPISGVWRVIRDDVVVWSDMIRDGDRAESTYRRNADGDFVSTSQAVSRLSANTVVESAF